MQYTNGNPGKESRNVAIGTDRALGATYNELAEKYNLSSKHISRILNDSEVKDIVETCSRLNAAYTPLALSRFYDILDDPKHSDHYKAIKDNLQSTGILPSHTQSQTIINIINQNNTIVEDPRLLAMMKRYSQEAVTDVDLGLDEDIIDVEP